MTNRERRGNGHQDRIEVLWSRAPKFRTLLEDIYGVRDPAGDVEKNIRNLLKKPSNKERVTSILTGENGTIYLIRPTAGQLNGAEILVFVNRFSQLITPLPNKDTIQDITRDPDLRRMVGPHKPARM